MGSSSTGSDRFCDEGAGAAAAGGSLPVIISNMTTPSEKMSLR